MNYRHLRYFIAAVEHGSFRKAGIAIGVHESTLSRRIRDLEDHLGASLFIRTPGGIRLTNAGERFVAHARKTLWHIRRGEQDIAAIGRSDEGRVRIGIFSSLASGFLFELLQAFSRDHENVQIDIIEGDPADHIMAIRHHRLDVAFVTGTAERAGCEAQHLWSERVYAVLPAGFPISDNGELTWRDLLGQRFIVSDVAPGQEIHDYLVKRLADLGHHPQIELQYVGRDNLLPLVAVGRGITVMAEAATAAYAPGIMYRTIADEILPYSAVWSPKNDNPALRRLLCLARAMARRWAKAL